MTINPKWRAMRIKELSAYIENTSRVSKDDLAIAEVSLLELAKAELAELEDR